MKIIGQALTPLFWGGMRIVQLAVSTVANRIFVEAYTFYHSFRGGDINREIENLDNAISALNKKDDQDAKNTFLPPLISSQRQFVQKGVTAEMVLKELQIHRFSITHLWRGVEKNETLIQYISDYITPLNSPYRRSNSSYSPALGEATPRRLFQGDGGSSS